MAMNYHELIVHDGKTELHYAAEENNIPMVNHLIDNNHDVDDVDNQGNTPLMLAIKKNSYDTAILLVKVGANIDNLCIDDAAKILSNEPSSVSGNYHMIHMSYEYSKVVKIIFSKLKKDCHNDKQMLLTKLRDFGCSLIQVMSFRDANLTRLMLRNGYLVDERDVTNRTALHQAVSLGDFENVKVLLEFGASVKALDKSQKPPLYYLYHIISLFSAESADGDERVKILKILIKHGALSVPDGIGRPPVEYICEDGDSRAITTLIQYNVDFNDYSILSSLLANDGIDALELLRGHNIDVNVQVAGELPLLAASVYSYGWKNMQFLLKRGADPNAVSYEGLTALVYVFEELSLSPENAALAKIRLLLQYGADAQYTVNNELTVFDLQSIHGHVISPAIFEPIIAHLAIIDSISDIGITDLIRNKIYSQETLKNHFEKCKQLLEKQLETMKETTIYESVTMYKLLTESHTKISRYARNPKLAVEFKEAMKVRRSLEPYYSIALHQRVGKAIHEAKLKEKAAVVLKKIFRCRFKNYRGIFGEILDYLTLDDLKNICKIYDLQESDSFNLNTIFV